jgi:Tol biopolymer transport system component
MSGGFVPDIVATYLVFYREGKVLAQPFDENRLELTGDPAAVAENIGIVMSYAFFSASTNGVIAYRSGGAQNSRLTWFDRNGTRLGTAGDENGVHLSLALSPDGTRAVAAIMRSDQFRTPLNLWLVDLTRPASARFTFSRLPDVNPVWSPDGSQIVFSALRGGAMDLYQKRVSGAGEEEVLLHTADSKTATSWSRDGRFLLYEVMDQATRNDLWVLPMQGERKPAKFLSTPFNETQGQFSPDGGRVAYTSDESGRNEVYVRTFPGAEGKQIISQGGGHSPHWRGDGKELFYLSADGKLMAAEVGGSPKALFEPPRGFGAWDAASDGKRFVFAAPLDQNAQAPFTVVLNWPAALKR